jgi:hypothetical protein
MHDPTEAGSPPIEHHRIPVTAAQAEQIDYWQGEVAAAEAALLRVSQCRLAILSAIIAGRLEGSGWDVVEIDTRRDPHLTVSRATG